MNENDKTQPIAQSPQKKGRHEIPTDVWQEILHLHAHHYGTREIGRRVGRSRKTVRNVLEKSGVTRPPQPSGRSKLEPFLEAIASRVKTGLTVSRILREIRELGYEGGRTILAVCVRSLRQSLTLLPRKQVKRRFETGPAKEMQIDWSPYTVPIAGRPMMVHALGCLLCFSRKLFLGFYRDERQPTLLEGLATAFEYFHGCAHRVVLDNMATAVLGRLSRGEVLWHPRFFEFARHYGFEPYPCKPRDPDRKGKKEKTFRLIWDDFLNGAAFDSWEDLQRRARVWLDETPDVANRRIHGTTRRVPSEAYLDERDLLIRLPRDRFAVFEQGIRDVYQDSTLSIRGTRYTVPSALALRAVAVRLYTEHFEVLGPHGQVAFSRRYADGTERGGLVIDETHYAQLPRRRRHGEGGERLDQAFVRRFPSLAPLCDGLKVRFKTLAPIHLRALLRLCDRFGEEAFIAAATRSQDFRRFDAYAVERILEREHPLAERSDPVPPLGGIGPTVLGEVEAGDLDSYRHLDGDPRKEATESESAVTPTSTPKKEDEHGA